MLTSQTQIQTSNKRWTFRSTLRLFKVVRSPLRPFWNFESICDDCANDQYTYIRSLTSQNVGRCSLRIPELGASRVRHLLASPPPSEEPQWNIIHKWTTTRNPVYIHVCIIPMNHVWVVFWIRPTMSVNAFSQAFTFPVNYKSNYHVQPFISESITYLINHIWVFLMSTQSWVIFTSGLTCFSFSCLAYSEVSINIWQNVFDLSWNKLIVHLVDWFGGWIRVE